MAEDLTPDPNDDGPAEGTDLVVPDAPDPVEAPTTDPTPVGPASPSGPQGPLPRHRAASRFTLIKLAAGFAALLILLIGASSLGASGTQTGGSDAWSEWTPSATGAAGAKEIAAHVGPEYRREDGKQLVAVAGGELVVANLPVRIALRNSQGDGGVQMVDGAGVLYTLCGMGPNCSIDSGRPSEARMLLLRREALELALYTFHSDPDLENVVVLLPPRPGSREVKMEDGSVAQVGNQGAGLLFKRNQLESELDAPLVETIPAKTPTVATMTSSPGAEQVARITAPSLFMVSIKQGQDATAFLVFDPMG